MNNQIVLENSVDDLRHALAGIIERRLLPIEDGPWVVEGACVSARTVANAKAQPAATSSIEVAVDSEDGWNVVVRAAVCRGKLWQPERWLHLRECGDTNGRSDAEIMALFAKWVEAV